MGRLRCVFTRSDQKKALTGFKKRFWVVNEAEGCLDMYKNDQAHIPVLRLQASDLRGVVFSSDRQNRFFVMQLQTKSNFSVVFRMGSFEERETWSTAISKLIEKRVTVNRRLNIHRYVVRRCAAAAKHFNVNISVDPAQHILSDIPESFLQFVPEAVDQGLQTVGVLVTTYRDDPRAPIHYTLDILAIKSRELTPSLRNPRYNPEKGGVILNVLLFRNTSGKVDFSVTPAEEVDQLLSSDVFRNPLIEGYIESRRGIRKVCNEIRSLLGTSTVPLTITFEWSGFVGDGQMVERYLRRHVNQEYFEKILHVINSAIFDLQHIIEGELFRDILNRDASFGANNLNNASINNTAASSTGRGSPPTTPRGAALRTQHSRSSSAYIPPSSSSPNLFMTGAPAQARPSDTYYMAVRLIAENITGLAIQLNAADVVQGDTPPEVKCIRDTGFNKEHSPGLLIMKHCWEVFNMDMAHSSLKEEVFLAGYSAFLTILSNAWRSRFRALFDKKITVSIDWRSFMVAIKTMNSTITAEDLPEVMSSIVESLYSRFSHTVQFLIQDVEDTGIIMDDFVHILYSCVRYISVVCVSGSVSSTTPTLRDGVLTDYWQCTTQDPLSQSMRATALPTKLNACQAGGVFITPACPRLGNWLENHFSDPKNCEALDMRFVNFSDEYYFDATDTDTEGEGQISADLGDAVALERGAEMGFLTLRRVVNVVYDSQDGCLTDLKISADSIRLIARHLRHELGMAYHDVQKVLIANLSRLRTLYNRSVDIEAREELDLGGLVQVLKDYCEYLSSEELITPSIREMVGSPASDNISGSVQSGQRVTSYSYALLCDVALQRLLPNEFREAKKAWKRGMVCGLENTGKTLIINAMKGVSKPTVASVGLSKQVVCFKEWVLALSELGGRESFRRNFQLYAKRMKKVDFVIFTIDSQDVRSFNDVYSYLKEVASFFPDKPLVVIFNNHRVLPRPITKKDLEDSVHLDKIRNIDRNRCVISCLCDVSVVQPGNCVLPRSLEEALTAMSEELKRGMKPDELPSQPKAPVHTTSPSASPRRGKMSRDGQSESLQNSIRLSRAARGGEAAPALEGVNLQSRLESPSPDMGVDLPPPRPTEQPSSSMEWSLLQRSVTLQNREDHSPFAADDENEREQSTTLAFSSPTRADKDFSHKNTSTTAPRGTENDLTLEQSSGSEKGSGNVASTPCDSVSVVCVPTPAHSS